MGRGGMGSLRQRYSGGEFAWLLGWVEGQRAMFCSVVGFRQNVLRGHDTFISNLHDAAYAAGLVQATL